MWMRSQVTTHLIAVHRGSNCLEEARHSPDRAAERQSLSAAPRSSVRSQSGSAYIEEVTSHNSPDCDSSWQKLSWRGSPFTWSSCWRPVTVLSYTQSCAFSKWICLYWGGHKSQLTWLRFIVEDFVLKRLATHLIELLKASHCPQLLVIKSVLRGGAVDFNEAHYTHPSLYPGRRHPVRKSVNKYSQVKNCYKKRFRIWSSFFLHVEGLKR